MINDLVFLKSNSLFIIMPKAYQKKDEHVYNHIIKGLKNYILHIAI